MFTLTRTPAGVIFTIGVSSVSFSIVMTEAMIVSLRDMVNTWKG